MDSVATDKDSPAYDYGLEILRQRERLYREKKLAEIALRDAAKPQPSVEHRPLDAVAVPTVSAIEARAQSSDQSATGAIFRSRSGGYPDLALKKEIYTLLYATQVKALKDISARAAAERSYFKPGTHSEDVQLFMDL